MEQIIILAALFFLTIWGAANLAVVIGNPGFYVILLVVTISLFALVSKKAEERWQKLLLAFMAVSAIGCLGLLILNGGFSR